MFGGVAATLAVLATPAGAATINVDTTVDEYSVNNGRCSLREAIYAANNDAAAPATGCEAALGNDTINVPAGTYVLDEAPTGDDIAVSGDLDITEFVTITHSGLRPAIVDGNGLDRVFHNHSISQSRLIGLTVTGGSLTGSSGGGVFNASGASLLLDRVTFRDNQGLFGGGASNAGDLTVTNSTFFGNRAVTSGGGLSLTAGVGSTASVTSTTVAQNTADSDDNTIGDGGGIAVSGAGNASIGSVVIAGNSDRGGEAPDCFQMAGIFQSTGNVLVQDPTGCSGLTNGAGDQEGANPLLGPLAFNGGPTQTMVLRRGSPAINNGGPCSQFDQRGVRRINCDIGSYERRLIRGVLVNLVGTTGRDRIKGTRKRDAILGFAGRDVLRGRGGRDVLVGGAGRDRCFGGPGRDRYRGCEVKR
jgi:CSLREA domain-containing protein